MHSPKDSIHHQPWNKFHYIDGQKSKNKLLLEIESSASAYAKKKIEKSAKRLRQKSTSKGRSVLGQSLNQSIMISDQSSCL